ncbi:formate dehydrogenase [Intrasporangium oryzae NRRL B-24470]|uniref:Formate dehydrogenase n=1 Tax=Intrasporangium oryzae NRRL B-24470 TaxID=1386089 RepID=W9G8Z7_9MICO|nr:NADH-ubiquinone oxidoreductase-F iron-sulfur binding region domain-containing protein [Intrasporangium oryzae]EWT01308.1 formate dehydrogenase [Intrasporangium oryzae NRRL B-24470]
MTLVTDLRDAGLAGRGGAAFSTATKVEAAHTHDADLIVNACDGELGAAKDGWVVEHHLDAVARAAALVAPGRRRRIRYAAHRGSATALRLRSAGLDLLEVPGRYVSSEETSLISLAQGGLARPMTKRQPFVRGGTDSTGRRIRPTVVLNSETMWRIGQVVDYGPEWFRSFGTAVEPGPRLVTISAPGIRGRVVQTEAGTPVADLLHHAGGPFPETSPVLVGGLGGAFLTIAEARGLRWESQDLARFGATVGPGVIEVFDDRQCPVVIVDRILAWAAGESAGQCGPCMFGLPAVAGDWHALAVGADPRAWARLQERVGLLPGRGACRFPDGVAGFVRSALRVFGPHLAVHAAAGSSPSGCPDLDRRADHVRTA